MKQMHHLVGLTDIALQKKTGLAFFDTMALDSLIQTFFPEYRHNAELHKELQAIVGKSISDQNRRRNAIKKVLSKYLVKQSFFSRIATSFGLKS